MAGNKTFADVIESGYGMPTVIAAHIIDKGWELCSMATDEEIDALEGNPVMTKDFVQWIVRTARDVCANFDMYKDFIPYIANELPVSSIERHTVTINSTDMTDDKWEDICMEFDAWNNNGTAPDSITITITNIDCQ